MGLREQLIAGTRFDRHLISLPEFDLGRLSGSIASSVLGGTYVILNVSANKPCRLRLYSDSASVSIDANRPSSSFNLDKQVGLNLEAVLTSPGANYITLNPPVIGTTFAGGTTWFNASSSLGPTQIQFEVYNIAANGDSALYRSELRISQSAIPTTGNGVSGSIMTKKSFLILSGSATAVSRLRLYSTAVTNVPLTECSRAFGTQPEEGSKLIADFMFDEGNFSYKLVPLVEAYTWNENDYATGTGEIGYILANRTADPATITASLYIYSTEE